MSLLERMRNKPEKPKGLLEQVLYSLHHEGILQSHIENILEQQSEPITQGQKMRLSHHPVNFLISDFKNQSDREIDQQNHLLKRMKVELDPQDPEITREQLEQLKHLFINILDDEGLQLPDSEVSRLWQYLVSEIAGFSILDPLLADHTISEIIVFNYQTVYVTKDGQHKLHLSTFRDENTLYRIIDRMFSGAWDDPMPFFSTRISNNVVATCLFPHRRYFQGPFLIIHRS